MKEDYILDAFGNMPGMVLNAAFNLRRPIEYSHKYFHFFEQPHDLESIAEFFATGVNPEVFVPRIRTNVIVTILSN
ncbi:MAG: hypothetical protein ACJ72U_02000 [Nitrososphaeraceae archaeon]